MSDLVVSIFRNKSQAEQARRKLLDRDRDGALGLEDVVTVEKTESGRIRLHHLSYFTLAGAFGGAFMGAIAGTLLLNPIFVVGGLLIGFITGLVAGFATIGISPDTIRDEASNLHPGQAALWVQPVENSALVAEEISKSTDDTLQTSICTLSEEAVQCSPWRSAAGDGFPLKQTEPGLNSQSAN
jgi:uncharacterized membrane protein